VMKAYASLQNSHQLNPAQYMSVSSIMKSVQSQLRDDVMITQILQIRQAVYSLFTAQNEDEDADLSSAIAALELLSNELKEYGTFFTLAAASALSDYTSFSRCYIYYLAF